MISRRGTALPASADAAAPATEVDMLETQPEVVASKDETSAASSRSPTPTSEAKEVIGPAPGTCSPRTPSPDVERGGNDPDVYEDYDNYDELDLEHIEAKYRAARARAIFSAGAARKVAQLERARDKAGKMLKRDEELGMWTLKIESKVTQLQARLFEQRSLLTWGPPEVLQTSRLDRAAVLQLRAAIQELNTMVEDLEMLSRFNTPRTQPQSAIPSSRSQHSESSSGLDQRMHWPMPSNTKVSSAFHSFADSSRAHTHRRPWRWSGRDVSTHKVQRVISECINSWNPAETRLDVVPDRSSVIVHDAFCAFLDTPRTEPGQEIAGNTELLDEFEIPETVHASEADDKQDTSEKAETWHFDAEGRPAQKDEGDDQQERQESRTNDKNTPNDTQGCHRELEMSLDVGHDLQNGKGHALSTMIQSPSGAVESPGASAARFQQSVVDELESPVNLIHPMWAPSNKSMQMSEAIGRGGYFDLTESARPRGPCPVLSTGQGTPRQDLRVLPRDRKARLPRILGLDQFQDAYETRMNFGHAKDCMEENLDLAEGLRERIRQLRTGLTERKRKMRAAVKAVKLINSMTSTVKQDEFEVPRSHQKETTPTDPAPEACEATKVLERQDTFSDGIVALQDELADLEATFRTCNICAGHFTGEEDRRGPPPEVPEKNSLQRDIEKLAYFAANEIQPTLRQALSTAVTSAYSTTHVQHNVVSKSIMQALESQEQTGFYSTKLRALAEIPAHLHVEVTMKKAKARSEMIVNMKRELIAYETAKGTSRPADLSELEIIRREVHQKVMKAKERRNLMRKQLTATLRIQGLWRGIACRDTFRKKGIHISSPLEEHCRKNLLPQLAEAFNSSVAVRREGDWSSHNRKQRHGLTSPLSRNRHLKDAPLFAGMVNEAGEAHGWGCVIFSESDVKGRTKYMGEFRDGRMNGLGVLTFKNGAKCEAQFQDDVPHGCGVEYFASGATYQGQFEQGSRHGLGVYCFPSGKSYGGSWLHGKQHGEGVETSILRHVGDPSQPRSEIMESLRDLSASQHELMEKGERAMTLANDLIEKGCGPAAKQAVKDSIAWMDKSHQMNEDIRKTLLAQEHSGRSLVRFDRGCRQVKDVVDPNALGEKVSAGGWVELNIDFDSKPAHSTSVHDGLASKQQVLQDPRLSRIELPDSAGNDSTVVSMKLAIQRGDAVAASMKDLLRNGDIDGAKAARERALKEWRNGGMEEEVLAQKSRTMLDLIKVSLRDHADSAVSELHRGNNYCAHWTDPSVKRFFQKFPDAVDGPLKPGQPGYVYRDQNPDHFSIFQIEVKTEDDQVWWYQESALRPSHPSLKQRMRRDAERLAEEMEQRELDQIRTEEIVVDVSRVISDAVLWADAARDGAAQTAATCDEILIAMQRMPTVQVLEPKTDDGADFVRAMQKFRDREDYEAEEVRDGNVGA